MSPLPIDVDDLNVNSLGKRVTVQQGDGSAGYLLGRLVQIRHRFAEDGATRETRIQVEIFGGKIVSVTLGPGMQVTLPA